MSNRRQISEISETSTHLEAYHGTNGHEDGHQPIIGASLRPKLGHGDLTRALLCRDLRWQREGEMERVLPDSREMARSWEWIE